MPKVLILGFLLVAVNLLDAATIRIPEDYITIQSGILASVDGDSVIVADGTYTGPGNKNIDFAGMAITVMSENGPESTIIDCEKDGVGFIFSNDEGADSKLQGFTVNNGFANFGGGIFCDKSSPTIQLCIFYNNIVTKGGGIYFYGPTSSTVINCTFYKNYATEEGGAINCHAASPIIENCNLNKNSTTWEGGGVNCHGTASPILSNCTINDNVSGADGGGINCHGASNPIITDCIISSNIAFGSYGFGGGGITCRENSSPVINNSIISENRAFSNNLASGGGIFCRQNSSPTIRNCYIINNFASGNYGYGGGICCNVSSSPSIVFCTISGNVAAGISSYGGGISCLANSTPIIANCILWNNLPNEISAHQGEPDVSYSDIEGGWTGTGNIDLNPLFLDPEYSDYHLEQNSPCIDTGMYVGLSIDSDGDPRPLGYWFDMGSDEVLLLGPRIHTIPGSFNLLCEFEQPAGVETLAINSIGSEILEYSVSQESEPWLLLSGEFDGLLDPGDSTEIIMQFDTEGLAIGEYIDSLSITSDDPLHPLSTIPVTLTIANHGIVRVPEDRGTIQAAVDVSFEGDTVMVAEGVYTGTGNREIDFLGKRITVMSKGGPESTVIDCELAGRGFYFHSHEDSLSRVEGFTITNGYAPDFGGGIYCIESSPVIKNVIIKESSAASMGGGIYCNEASPLIRSCSIKENLAVSMGGGIYCSDNSTPVITTSMMLGNSSETGSGGGIFCLTSSPVIANCILTDNTAARLGGGIACVNRSTPNILNCTFTKNSASYAGGIFCYNYSETVITNCIMWNDSPNELDEVLSTPEITYSNIKGGWDGNGNIDEDPQFVPFSKYGLVLLLQINSPCIDTGDPSIEDTLYDWYPQWPHYYPNGARSDMGAYGGKGNMSWLEWIE